LNVIEFLLKKKLFFLRHVETMYGKNVSLILKIINILLIQFEHSCHISIKSMFFWHKFQFQTNYEYNGRQSLKYQNSF